MATARNLTRLGELIRSEDFDGFRAVVAMLEQFGRDLKDQVLRSENLEIRVETGYKVNLGRQLKVIVRVVTQGFSDVLIRAYVPDNGYPATVNFVGLEEQAEDTDALLQILYEVIPANEDIRSRLMALHSLALEASSVE